MPRRLFTAVLLSLPAWAGGAQEILVSAPRLDDLDLMEVDTAADITVIDREKIEASGAVSVPELLRSEANLLIRSTSGNPNDGQIAMRGFGGNSHLRTLVLVDGHKMNRPDMGVESWQAVPVSSIERIEVIRGGQNVLYGDHALAGVVKITTRRGARAGSRVGGTMGSYGYLSGFAGGGAAVADVDIYAGVDSYAMDGYRSNSTSRATTLSGSLAWYVGDADTLTVRAAHTDSHIQFPGPITYEQMQEDSTQSGNLGDEFSDTESSLATAIWETERDWGRARLASGINVRDMDWEVGGIVANNRQSGVSLGPRVKWGGDDDFVLGGIDLFFDGLDFTSFVPSDRQYENAWAELERTKWSPYFFAQRKTEKNYIFGGGARYEQARTENLYVDYVDSQILPYIRTNRGTFPNPNYKNPPDSDPLKSYEGTVSKEGWAGTLSLTREFDPAASVWIKYDRVYRYPSLDEVASYQSYPLSDPLNENLDPETGNVLEIGSRWLSRPWSLAASAYLMAMENEIVFDDTAKLNRNLGATRRMGTELELELDRRWHGFSSRWTLQDARLDDGENDGNHVPLAPPFYGIFAVWIQLIEELRLTLDYTYVSEQYQGNDEANTGRKMDDYGLVGLRMDVQMNAYARLNASIDNLLDVTYATTAYSGAFYPGPGRSFRCGITLEF